MNPTVPKAELLERERRWKKPAGFASLVAATLIVGSTVIQQSATGSRADDTTELLEQYHDHGGALLAGNVVAGVGFLLLCIPLWFLFNAASGRSHLVRRAFLAFAFIGPILLGVQGVVSSIGLMDAGDKFAEQSPAVEREARAERPQGEGAQQKPGTGEASGGEGTSTGGDATTATEATETEATETESTETETTPETAEERVDDAREELADDLVSDSGTQSFAIALLFPGALGMVVGMVYIPLWAMRTGLITRFWGSLGMALGVSLILLGPLGQLFLVVWFAALGLMLIGLWPTATPPAWEEGEAVPWLRPGEPPPGSPGDDTVEGSGREISEPPLPEEPPPDAPPPAGAPYEGESQGERRKKRKRRS